jgi:hypothetical protein
MTIHYNCTEPHAEPAPGEKATAGVTEENATTLKPEPPNTAGAIEIHGDWRLAEALADEMLILQVNALFED